MRAVDVGRQPGRVLERRRGHHPDARGHAGAIGSRHALGDGRQHRRGFDLSWGAATDNVGVAGYQIFRCTGSSCSNYALLTATSGAGTIFSDTGLTAGTSYSYEVRAVDAAGNQGAFSNIASTTTPDRAGHAAAVRSGHALRDRREQRADRSQLGRRERQRRRHRLPDLPLPGEWLQQLHAAHADRRHDLQRQQRRRQHELQLPGARLRRRRQQQRRYEYRLGYHPRSAGHPGAVRAGHALGDAASTSRIDLSWGAATDNVGVTGYQIYRCTGSGCSNFALLTQIGAVTSYSDTGLAAGTTYGYQCARWTPRATRARSRTRRGQHAERLRLEPRRRVLRSTRARGTTVADASGTGNGGTTLNTTWSTTGKFGGALTFNGTSARVNIPNSARCS